MDTETTARAIVVIATAETIRAEEGIAPCDADLRDADIRRAARHLGVPFGALRTAIRAAVADWDTPMAVRVTEIMDDATDEDIRIGEAIADRR